MRAHSDGWRVVRVTSETLMIAREAAGEAGLSVPAWLGRSVRAQAELERAIRGQAGREERSVFTRFEEVPR